MRMKVPLFVRLAVCGALMESHGIRKGSLENIVAARSQALQDIGQSVASGFREFIHGTDVALADDKGFKGPDRPEWHEGSKLLVFTNDALLESGLDLQVLAEQASSVPLPIIEKRRSLFRGLIGNGSVGPNLAVWMRVARAHHGATIFEDKDIIDPRLLPEFSILADPDINDCPNLSETHSGERQVMASRKTDHPTIAAFAAGDEQAGVVLVELRRGRQKRGKVIVKDKSGFVLGVL